MKKSKDDNLKINREVPMFIIGTKMICFTRVENEQEEQSIVFAHSTHKDFAKSKYCYKRPKDDEILFGLTFTNKGTVTRFIEMLEEMREDIQYEEIEDWEKGNGIKTAN